MTTRDDILLERNAHDATADATARWNLLVADLVLTAICIIYWRSLSGVHGSDYWYPTFIAAFTGAITLVHAVISLARTFVRRATERQTTARGESAQASRQKRLSNLGKVGAVVVLCLAYSQLLNRVGMVLGTFVVTVALGWLAGWRRWPALVIVAITFGFLTYYLFSRILGYPIAEFPGQ